jgi:SAM-dependent methyltransferase
LTIASALPSAVGKHAMKVEDAIALIGSAVTPRGGTWADLGAGTGTFTRALARLLGDDGTVYAVERDARALDALRAIASRDGARVVAVPGDFTAPLELPPLDGALIANALHFVRDGAAALAHAAAWVRPGGRIVVVEYEGRPPSRWVPYPVSLALLRALATSARLGEPELIGTRHSAYGGEMYAASIAAGMPV